MFGTRRIGLGAAVLAGLAGSASADLIAYFDFEGPNAYSDKSGMGVVATNNGTTIQSGLNGNSAFFSGSTSIDLALDINPSALSELTMGAWVSADVASGVRQVISHDNGGFDRSLGYDTRAGSGVRWTAFRGSGVVTGTPTVATDETVFLAVAYSASGVRLHVNDEVFAASNSTAGGFGFTRIGGNPPSAEYFVGLIDDVFFFDEALSDSAIEDIRLNGVPAPSAAAVLGLSGLAIARRRR